MVLDEFACVPLSYSGITRYTGVSRPCIGPAIQHFVRMGLVKVKPGAMKDSLPESSEYVVTWDDEKLQQLMVETFAHDTPRGGCRNGASKACAIAKGGSALYPGKDQFTTFTGEAISRSVWLTGKSKRKERHGMKTGALKAVQPQPKTVQEWIRLRRIELRKAGKAKETKAAPMPARLFLVKRSKPARNSLSLVSIARRRCDESSDA